MREHVRRQRGVTNEPNMRATIGKSEHRVWVFKHDCEVVLRRVRVVRERTEQKRAASN